MSLDKDERETPPELFKALDDRFGFTLDAAASAKNAKLPRFNSLEDPNRFDWKGERVWCNPPYSEIRVWVEKALISGAELVYLLVPNWTDRAWWQELIEPCRDRGQGLRTEFMPRHRFLKDGKPIMIVNKKTGKETVGQPEFGLVGIIIT